MQLIRVIYYGHHFLAGTDIQAPDYATTIPVNN